MGTPDSFGKIGIQLKVGEPLCRHFKVGDRVSEDIPDGVYVDYAGVVVISDGVFVAEFPDLQSKYGDRINLRDLVDQFNPVAQVVKQWEAKRESEAYEKQTQE